MSNNTFLISMGRRIAAQRKELHLTQEQLADKMNVSLQTISCIELGKKAIRPENLANLCSCLGVSSDYILYGKRTDQQMSDILTKLSRLPDDSYRAVETMISLLYGKR